jgi:hypothetical protein
MARGLLWLWSRRSVGLGSRIAQVAVVAILAIVATGCIIAPALPVEEPPPNLPPLISGDFVTPRSAQVTIPREDAPVAFAVSQFLDANQNELLDVLWYSPHAVGAGVLQIGFASPDPSNTDLYRGVFNRYTGSQFSVDPCGQEWRGVDRSTLFVYVSDGRMRIDDNGTPVIPEENFVDVYSWTIEFSGECPEQ